jgi:hypothetical protein
MIVYTLVHHGSMMLLKDMKIDANEALMSDKVKEKIEIG